MQFIAAEKIEGDRKQYSITQTGVEYLNAQQAQVENILGRFETRRKIHTQTEYIDIKRAMENLKASLRLKLQIELSPDQVRELTEHIDHVAVNTARATARPAFQKAYADQMAHFAAADEALNQR